MKRLAELEILYRDQNLVAVNKPAGLAAIPGRGESDSLLQQLAAQLGLPCVGTADPRLRVVHRLDKETSGVMLFATDVAAQRHLSHQFQNNTIEKEYLALVSGHVMTHEGAIDAPLCANPRSPRHMIIDQRHGRPAKTLWRLEERFGNVLLIRALPRTGKTHQIRVHLKSAGLPLLVDDLYNPVRPPAQSGLFLSSFKRDYRADSSAIERPLIARLTLHAEKLRFTDPAGARHEVIAALPKDFRSALNMLRKYGRRGMRREGSV